MKLTVSHEGCAGADHWSVEDSPYFEPEADGTISLQAEKIAEAGRMAATIAHEINKPLEAVMNLLYLLRPMITAPEGVQCLNSVETELGRVSHITKTLGYYREQASASSGSLSEILEQATTIYEPLRIPLASRS